MGKHLEQALALCVCPPVLNWLKQIKIITFSYLGGLPEVGSECGAWPESGWLADQVTMGWAFFQPF